MYDKEFTRKIFISLIVTVLTARLFVYILEAYVGLSDILITSILVGLTVPVAYLVSIIYHNRIDKLKKDELTGLYTRKYSNILSEALGNVSNSMVIILIDVDNFKMINDKYGHHIGDRVLKAISTQLSKSIRSNDAVIRWGGDEFVVAYRSDISPEVFSQRIDRHIQEASKGLDLDISVSKGISVFPDDSTEFKELVKIADERMYKEKYTKLNNNVQELKVVSR